MMPAALNAAKNESVPRVGHFLGLVGGIKCPTRGTLLHPKQISKSVPRVGHFGGS